MRILCTGALLVALVALGACESAPEAPPAQPIKEPEGATQPEELFDDNLASTPKKACESIVKAAQQGKQEDMELLMMPAGDEAMETAAVQKALAAMWAKVECGEEKISGESAVGDGDGRGGCSGGALYWHGGRLDARYRGLSHQISTESRNQGSQEEKAQKAPPQEASPKTALRPGTGTIFALPFPSGLPPRWQRSLAR